MVFHSSSKPLSLDNYFDDYDFEDRPVLVESPRLNEFDTNMYVRFLSEADILDCRSRLEQRPP